MTDFLVRAFVKDYKNIENPEVRRSYGTFSGGVGIFCNLLLFVAKLIIGTISGSVSIVADAVNNLSDMISSIVTLIGFKAAGKPADVDHPFGHGRIEYIAGQIVSFVIIIMGVELLKSSFEKILHPETLEFSVFIIIILVASIALKCWMGFFNRGLGKKLNSPALVATSRDSFSDCITTSVVLAATMIQEISGLNVDGFGGLAVSAFVIIAGIQSTKETIQPLLGQMPSDETVKTIKDTVLADSKILGIHDMMVHDYGPGRVYAMLHAEIPATLTLEEAHEIIDAAETRVEEKVGCEISIHMDPVDLADKETLRLREVAKNVIGKIDPKITMHDFRMLKGGTDEKKIFFDIEVPNNITMTAHDLSHDIEQGIHAQEPDVEIKIKVDTFYVHQRDHLH